MLKNCWVTFDLFLNPVARQWIWVGSRVRLVLKFYGEPVIPALQSELNYVYLNLRILSFTFILMKDDIFPDFVYFASSDNVFVLDSLTYGVFKKIESSTPRLSGFYTFLLSYIVIYL
ncbi:hypothetical protein VNO78_05825 [Psophocarpus tetragonolobus]|uniref:Uncharacterized protein n=1 Tax=Psophocarpus tetragonolobus TaxID=3891 RepID=A0AAN9STH2_PSOTE